jgi:hypothetical protein
MKLMQKLFSLGAVLIFVFSGFTYANPYQNSNQDELTFKESIWAKKGANGRMVVVPDGVFRRGEVVNLILRKVGKFKQGTDGKHWFDLDMLVRDPKNEIILEQKNLLGEKGHLLLEEGIASSPYGIFETHVGLDPGSYNMTLTIRDKVSGAKVSITKSFTMAEGLSYKKAVFAKKNQEGSLVPIDDATFARGESVHMILLNVGKFKKGEDGKHRFDININVKNKDDKQIFHKENMLGDKGHVLLEKDIADSPYGIFYTNIEMEAGTYLMTLTIIDKISNLKVSVTQPFHLK